MDLQLGRFTMLKMSVVSKLFHKLMSLLIYPKRLICPKRLFCEDLPADPKILMEEQSNKRLPVSVMAELKSEKPIDNNWNICQNMF